MILTVITMEMVTKIECPICDWDWEIESDDDRPHLCHQCGYDSKLGDFDEEALHQWEEENDYPFENKVPFQEQKEEKYIIRTFSESTNDMELVWHRDREDRIVKGLGNTDWMIQMDNELPRPLTEMIYIPKNTYHRVIKGTGDLKVRINKLFTEEEKKYSTILIFGPQGVGKSTITKKLGEKLGMKVIGSDEVIDQGDWSSEKIWSKGWKIRKQNEYKGMMKYLKNNLGKPVILDVGGSHGVWDGDMLNEILSLVKNYENRFLIIPSSKEGENIEFLRGRLLKRELDAIPSNIRYWEAVLKGDESFGKDFNSYDKNEFTKRLEITKKDKTRATEMLKYNKNRYKALKSGVEWMEYDDTSDKEFDWDINKLEDYSKFFIDNMKNSGIGNHIIQNKGKSGEELSNEIIEKLK